MNKAVLTRRETAGHHFLSLSLRANERKVVMRLWPTPVDCIQETSSRTRE